MSSDARAKKEEMAKVNEHIVKLKQQMFEIKVEVLDGGKLPCKAHYTDAGFDVFATEDVVIMPGQIIKHPLNIRFQIPPGAWLRIEGKSGLGSKGMLVFSGVVDQSYVGIPHVIATNLNHESGAPIEIKKGNKIAQITVNPHSLEYYMKQVDAINMDTERGTGGFGSSGS